MDNGSAPPHGALLVSSAQTIAQALALYHDHDELFEIRSFRETIPATRFFTDQAAAVNYVMGLPIDTSAVYFTPNRLAPDTQERIRARKKGRASADVDVTHRQWLLIDLDAKRPAGLSSTDEEKLGAKSVAVDVHAACSKLGFTSPVWADSGNGWHLCYPLSLPETPAVKQAIQSLLLALAADHDSPHAHVDTGVFNASRIWKLPGTVARKGIATPTTPHRLTGFAAFCELPTKAELTAAREQNNAALLHGVAELKRLKTKKSIVITVPPDDQGGFILPGHRNKELFHLGCQLARSGNALEAVRQSLHEENIAKCRPPLEHDEVETVARKSHAKAISDQATANAERQQQPSASAPPAERRWPSPLPPAAFIGPIGQFVQAIEPHTEADPAVVLLHALLLFGSRLGRSLHVMVGPTPHYANNNLLVIGSTATGRKGVAASVAELLFKPMSQKADHEVTITSDPLHCLTSKGLSSGQGLVFALRNATADDPGCLDKRLAVSEPEFARVLAVARMKDSTLSTTIRDLWDSGNSQIMNKGTPVWSTGAHLSILASITAAELEKESAAVDYENGFLNRFIFCLSRRTQLIPLPTVLRAEDFEPTRNMLRSYVANALNAGHREIVFDQAAREFWCDELYAELERERFGMGSSLLARGSPHVRRLSLTYAASEGSSSIRLSHLQAAHELWKYAEASVGYIFGRSSGDKLADLIHHHLQAASGGLSAQGVHDALNRNYTEQQRHAALALLVKHGLATCAMESPNGRACMVWRAV
jgi:hypothetical protein